MRWLDDLIRAETNYCTKDYSNTLPFLHFGNQRTLLFGEVLQKSWFLHLSQTGFFCHAAFLLPLWPKPQSRQRFLYIFLVVDSPSWRFQRMKANKTWRPAPRTQALLSEPSKDSIGTGIIPICGSARSGKTTLALVQP